MQTSIVPHIETGQSPNWCFTLNNYVPDDEQILRDLFEDGSATYLVFGREIGESGTPHLQGFIAFSKKHRFQGVTRMIPRAHLSRARMPHEAAEYCKKDGDYEEFGDMTKRGKRNEMEEFKKDVRAGMLSMRDLRDKHSNIYARYKHFCVEYVADNTPKPTIDYHELRPWQQNLYCLLLQPPNRREIFFIVDLNGNQGKTWFAHYFASLIDNTQVIVPGKKADMAYILDEQTVYFFFDAPRSKQGEFIQYDFLEELKNGYVFSPKYESRVKSFQKCHVIVLTNEFPDMTKLSADRYNVITL